MKKKTVILFVVLIVLLLLLLVANLKAGSTDITYREILGILSGENAAAADYKIIWNIRIPRILAAGILGGALALAGYLLQAFFANPIAGPFVLGISSGAKLVVAVIMVLSSEIGFSITGSMMVAAAFVGALFSTAFVLAAAKKVHNMSILIVCGIMIGYICSAVTELLITFADDSNIVNLHNWSMGSFSSIGMDDVAGFTVIVIVGLVGALLLSKGIGAYLYGEQYAHSLGISVKLFRVLLILTSSLLSATVTAFAGPISFVGIAVPHVIRNLFHTSEPKIMIAGSFLGGAVFCLFCDLLARCMFAPTELSISTVTAIFGAPIVISMLLKKKRD